MITLLLSEVCLTIGAAALLLGAVGLLRFPDFFSRTHAASMTDTAGAGFVLLGLMILAGPTLITLKLGVILIFLLLTSPTAAHALAQAALVDGHTPSGQIEPDEEAP